jgi:putative component of membrane protein insertase Oxa1/YidC/SpoIIIJ protein YidD
MIDLNFLQSLALAAIRAYQRYLSPHKGFSCAYRIHTNYASCSALGYRAIRRHGVVRGIAVLRMRLYRCGVAARRFASAPQPRSRQAGFCDVMGCDIPSVACTDVAVPGLDAACWLGDCSGCGSRSTKTEGEVANEEQLHIPYRSPSRSMPSYDDEEIQPSEGGWKP